jgi:hypothetical protein
LAVVLPKPRKTQGNRHLLRPAVPNMSEDVHQTTWAPLMVGDPGADMK